MNKGEVHTGRLQSPARRGRGSSLGQQSHSALSPAGTRGQPALGGDPRCPLPAGHQPPSSGHSPQRCWGAFQAPHNLGVCPSAREAWPLGAVPKLLDSPPALPASGADSPGSTECSEPRAPSPGQVLRDDGPSGSNHLLWQPPSTQPPPPTTAPQWWGPTEPGLQLGALSPPHSTAVSGACSPPWGSSRA